MVSNVIWKPLKGWMLLTCICLAGIATGCDSLDNSIGEDPYGGGMEPLDIKLLMDDPIPAEGYPGDTVLFKAKGLMQWYDPEQKTYKFDFYLGEQNTEILTATDTTLTVRVPEACSSGTVYLVLQNQVFYGPNFTVLGNVAVDENFVLSQTGTDGVVYDCLPTDEGFYLVGGFTEFGGTKERNGISFIDQRGNVAGKNTTHFNLEHGLVVSELDFTVPYIRSISQMDDGKMMVAGSFNAYESNNNFYSASRYEWLDPALADLNKKVNVNNIVTLQANAVADTIGYWFDEGASVRDNNNRTVPLGLAALNGGTIQSIIRAFVTDEQDIVAVGNLTTYSCNVYASVYAANEAVTEQVASVFKMKVTGELDLNYRPASSHLGAGGGKITDACADADGGVVIVGDFTSFDGKPAPGIVRLDRNGEVDGGFQSRIGTGPDGPVSTIRYNRNLNRMVITGTFTQFNGEGRNYMAVLSADGTLDPEFVPKTMEGGAPNFAALLDKNKVVVSGTFLKYDGVPRPGFLILDADGAATQRFNVPGPFVGQLYQAVETVTTLGSEGLLLVGNFSRFNGEARNNVVMIETDLDN